MDRRIHTKGLKTGHYAKVNGHGHSGNWAQMRVEMPDASVSGTWTAYPSGHNPPASPMGHNGTMEIDICGHLKIAYNFIMIKGLTRKPAGQKVK